jgi:hypothetical protein
MSEATVAKALKDVMTPDESAAFDAMIESARALVRCADEWQLVFAVDRGKDRRQRHFVSVDPDAVQSDRWHLVKLGPTAWDIPQSIFVAGQIHAFVTIVDVPSPAPWERS